MKVYIKDLIKKASVKDFYLWALTGGIMEQKIKDKIYSILVSYGKIATESSGSLSNMDNIDFSSSIKGTQLTIDIEWGKNPSDKIKYAELLRKMRNGYDNVPTIESLEDWVAGKRKFFKKHPEILSTRAYFYNKEITYSDRDYAEVLQDYMLYKGGKPKGGDYVFKGQSKKATMMTSVLPIYGKRQLDFYEKIEAELENMLKKRMQQITIRLFQRYLYHKGGTTKTLCIYSNPNTLAIVKFSELPKKRQKFFEMVVDGKMEINTNKEFINDTLDYMRTKAMDINNIGIERFKRTYNNMSKFVSSNSADAVYTAIKRNATNSVYKPIKRDVDKIFKNKKK